MNSAQKNHLKSIQQEIKNAKLQQLIEEQQKELNQEKYHLTSYSGGTSNFQKGRKGIFVGNRIF